MGIGNRRTAQTGGMHRRSNAAGIPLRAVRPLEARGAIMGRDLWTSWGGEAERAGIC